MQLSSNMSNIFCILTGRQQVMFSVVSVCQREGAPAALYRAPTAKKCSNLFNLDLTVQGPPDMIKLVQLGPHLTTPYPLKTLRHSNLLVMKHVWSAYGRNDFLLILMIEILLYHEEVSKGPRHCLPKKICCGKIFVFIITRRR